MAFETAQDFIDVWAELDAAYVTFPALAGAGGNYQDDTPLDTTGADFDSVLAEFPEFAFILDNPDATVGQLALAVNSMFVALAEAYIDYLDGGGDPVLDIAKDRGGEPAPGQSYHDNILGNLGDGAIEDRFENSSNDPANNVDVTGDSVGDLVAEPRSADGQDYGGRPYVSGSSNNDAFGQAIAWDIAHGIDQSKLDVSRGGADPMAGEVYVVDSDGAVSQFSSIQAAVDAAVANDTVVIGSGTWTESVVIDKALSIFGAGADQTFIEPASGDGLEIEGDLGTDATVTIDGITFANATGSGVSFDDYAILGTLQITDSAFEGNSRNGVHIGDNANPIDLDNVIIEDSSFTGNGQPQGASGDGDIIFYQYNGDATLRNLTITGQDRGTGPGENAIQFLSNHGAMGNVVLDNITIDGVYEKTGIAIYEYDNVDGLSVTGVTVNAESGWNLPVNFDGIGGDIDLTTLDIDASGAPGVIALQGNDGDNTLTGNDGDNFLRGGVGNDVLTGNGGNDSAYFSGSRDDYTITQNGDGSYTFTDTNLTNGDEGADTLTGVEVVNFGGDPVSYKLDTNSPDQSGFNVHFSQGFEGNSAGILDASKGWSGSITIADSGDNGITAADGGQYAVFQQGGDPGDETGPFTRFDGYGENFGDGFNTQVKIYLDPNWADGEGFDWSVAASNDEGTHLRDFIFHIAKDADTGTVLIGASNNTDFEPSDNLEAGNHGSVDEAGWYTFETAFYENDAGDLEVAMNVYDANGDWVFTEILSNEGDDVSTDVGGHYYGWFTNIDVTDGIAVDSMTSSDANPIGPYQLQQGEARLGDFDTPEAATAAAGDGDVVTNGAGEFFVADGMSIQAAIDAASDGDTIHIADGSYTENLVIDKALSFVGEGGAAIDPASGTAVHIEAGIDGDISFDGVNLAGTGSAAIGIDVDEGANIGTLTFTNGDISGFDNRGIYASDDGDPDGTPTMANLVITNANFFGNGTGSGNTADVKLFGFSGSATFDTVTFDGTDGVAGSAGRPDSAIDITGYIDSEGNAHPLGPDAPDANITLNNVIVTGEYHKNPIALFHFSEVDGISITGLDLSGAESAWGPLFNLDGIEDADLDASVFGIIFPAGTDIFAEIQGEETGQGTIDSTITGTASNDSIHGKGGNDTLYGGEGADRLFGGNKPGQEFQEGQGDDNLYGQTGDDTLTGGLGNDYLDGGEGHDVAVFSGNQADYTIDFDAGAVTDNNTADGQDDGTDSFVNVETLEFADGQVDVPVEPTPGDDVLTGTSGDDSINGLTGNDTIYGLSGDDTLGGDAGNDTLDGGAGDDVLTGGAGDDSYVGDDGVDTAVIADNGGSALDLGTGYDLSGLTVSGGEVSGSLDGPDGTETLSGVEVLKVANTGGGSTFIVMAGMSIQAAVDAAQAGDTIMVGAGVYDEDVVIDKSLTLVSTDGAGSTTINGQNGASGSITILDDVNDVVIGGDGQGFTILGNNGNGAIENAAVYLQGDHDNIFIQGNTIEARGDAGLLSEYSATVTNVTIDDNVFSGQTFEGSEPGGFGFGDQFVPGNDVPRQLVTIGGNDQNSSNITFTGNTVSGTAGGTNGDGQEQGNTLVTIDAANSVISDNIFTGYTSRYATALRAREPGTDINNNTFDASANGSDNTAQIYVEEGTGNLDGNTFIGSANDDYLQGGSGDDSILAGDGDDYLFGSAGADFIDGEAGVNVLSYAASGDGVDVRLWRGGVQHGGDAEGDSIRNVEVVLGSDFNDVLQGNNGLDVTLDGAGGDDNLAGFNGNDALYGGDGDDRIAARSGDDFIMGGAGADIINGGNGTDTISYANSSAGVEVRLFQGGAQVGGEAAGDIIRQVENIIGSDFDDILQGNDGIDSVLSGGAGNDELRAYNGADTLNGGDGNDILVGNEGDDVFDGGAGNDAIYFSGVYADYTVDFDAGTVTDNNTGDGDDGSDTFSNVESLVFTDQTVTASGGPVATEGDDRLIGDGSDNTIDGLGGDDIINGNAGNDTLIGGAGDDVIVGRNGDDLIRGGSGADIMKGEDGFDTVDYSDSDAGVDIRLFRAPQHGGHAEGDIVRSMEGVIGSDYDDFLNGDDGIDVTLDGRGGDDRIIGYDGDDVLRGGDGDDRIVGQEGDDLIEGGAGDDRLIGQEGDDLLEGGAGADIINGGGGFDMVDYSNSDAGVTVYLWRGPGQSGGDAEGDILRQIEKVIGSEFDDSIQGDVGLDAVLDGRGGNDLLAGFEGDDTLLGGDGDDRLVARDGDDILDGGAGNDILRGQGDADTFIMGISGGVDTIVDFEDGLDVIDLTAFAVSDVNDLTISQVNNVTLISGFGDDGEMLRLVNVDQGDIDNSDFLFGA